MRLTPARCFQGPVCRQHPQLRPPHLPLAHLARRGLPHRQRNRRFRVLHRNAVDVVDDVKKRLVGSGVDAIKLL
jgi:hypothetical protein